MMNISGNDLLGNYLVNQDATLKKTNKNAESNPTQSNINDFRSVLNNLSLKNTSDENLTNTPLKNDNNILTDENFEDIDISKLNSDDILIIEVDENDNFFNIVSSIVTLLDNDKLDVKELLNVVEDANSTDELEEAMSKLLSELNIPIILMDKPITEDMESSLNVGADISVDINTDIEMTSSNYQPIISYSNEDVSILDTTQKLDITQKNNNIDKLVNYLENSNEPLTDKNITDILKKLNNLYNEYDSNNKLNSNKKKEVMVSLDNFNIDIAHNKVINLSGVEFSEEIQGASSKILEKITTAIHENMSATNLDNKTIEIRLKLYPKHLGELTIDILNNDGRINIKIFSENPSIKEFISSSMKELIGSLNNKNLAIDDIEVLLTGDTNSSFNNNNSNNSGNSNSSQKLNKFVNYINDNDINDENINNFESFETNKSNLYVNI